MKQYEAVIKTLELLGGQATLADLYREVLKFKGCKWETKTPYASIRRIVQTRQEIFRVRPGLWALRSFKSRLGLLEQGDNKKLSAEVIIQNHAYYQGILAIIGNLKGFSSFIPNQDKNKLFVNKPLCEIRSLTEIPNFSYDNLVKKSGTVDVTWFNRRQMPDSFFEIEFSTDIQNSLLKFFDLLDFSARMVIVADEVRRPEYEHKLDLNAIAPIKKRINFMDFETLIKEYEYEMWKVRAQFVV